MGFAPRLLFLEFGFESIDLETETAMPNPRQHFRTGSRRGGVEYE